VARNAAQNSFERRLPANLGATHGFLGCLVIGNNALEQYQQILLALKANDRRANSNVVAVLASPENGTVVLDLGLRLLHKVLDIS
jgi:hypothetical protein